MLAPIGSGLTLVAGVQLLLARFSDSIFAGVMPRAMSGMGWLAMRRPRW